MAPRRFRISYRVSLVLAIPLLVLATGGVIAFRTYIASRATVDQLAEDLFRNVSAQTVVQARAQIRRAVPMVELARLLVRDNPSLEQNSNALARQFTAILKANPEFSWVSYSNAAGDFTGAFRSAEGAYRTNQSAIRDGKTALVENNVDDAGNWTVHRRADDTHYDPRTRPFYTMAAEAKRRVWTSPYVFFDAAVPGITCAQPNLAPDGKLLGVFTVDFDLNNLSRFVEKLRLSEHGRIFIFDEGGIVIAHPTVRLVEKSGQGAAGKLVTTAEIDDPLVRAFFAAAPARVGDGFSFEHAGETWRASYTVFEIDEGLRWIVGAVAPERDFMGAVQRNNLVSLLVSLLAVALAVGLAFVLSSRVARPLAELASQMDEVGQLRLVDAPVRETLFAEIAMMDDALSRMKKGLRSFASYVPRDLVRAMLASGQEAVLAGDVKPLTIFFSDIAGFTTIAESMKPDALVKLLAGYFDETTRIIADKGGTVDKFIGDGIMAFWGAPEESADHAALACEAAILYQRCIVDQKRAGAEWAQHLQARIGVSTGAVLVGNIGSNERLNYTVMGDTVNTAARLEGLNKMYGTLTLISEATYLLARDRVVARAIDVAAVKGKALGTRVYELLCLASDEDAEARALAVLSEKALDAYLRRDFAAAATGYREILLGRPNDRAAQVLLTRVEEYLVAPPSEDWTGIHVMHEK